MTATLRPMNLGEILDRTFKIYRARFWVFLGIAALPAVGIAGVQLASYFLWGTYPEGWLDVGFGLTTAELGSRLGFYHFSLFFQLLIWPCIVYATSLSYSSELPALTLRSALGVGLARWRGLFALATLLLLVTLILPEVVISSLFLAITYLCSEVLKFNSDTMDLILTPAIPLFCVAGWVAIGWMSAVISCAIPGRKLEGLSTLESIRRGWALSKGHRFRIFVAWFMPAILGLILVFIVSRLLTLFLSSCSSDQIYRYEFQSKAIAAFLPWNGWCVSAFALEGMRIASEGVISTLLGPIFPISVTLFYYDQRIRLEGYDIECMMKAAGMEHGAAGKSEAFLGSASANSLRVASAAQDALIDGEGQA